MAEKQFERFFARVLIQHVKGATICYLYNREVFDEVLGVEREQYDNSQFIEIGKILTINGRKYKVMEMNMKLEDHINEMGHGYGINVYSPTEPTDFNVQIGVFVDNAD